MRSIILITVALFATLAQATNLAPATPLQAASGVEHPEAKIFESTINATLNAILTALPDPLSIDELDVVLPGGVLDGYFNVSNVQLTGLSTIVASQISLSILSLALTMTIQTGTINLNLNYDGDAVIANLIPLYGAGKANINLENLVFSVGGAANLTGGISLKDVTVKFTIGGATFDLHGLLNNEDFSSLVSAAFNDNFADFFNNNADALSDIISPIAEVIINLVLSGSSSRAEQFDKQIDALYNRGSVFQEKLADMIRKIQAKN